MNIENQVCSLELSKKLKELGMKQNSLFEYRKFDNGKNKLFWSKPILVGSIPKKIGVADVGFGKLSAFTVAELGEMLPENYNTHKNNNEWTAGNHRNLYNGHYEDGDTEADARAKMLIYLIENKLLTP